MLHSTIRTTAKIPSEKGHCWNTLGNLNLMLIMYSGLYNFRAKIELTLDICHFFLSFCFCSLFMVFILCWIFTQTFILCCCCKPGTVNVKWKLNNNYYLVLNKIYMPCTMRRLCGHELKTCPSWSHTLHFQTPKVKSK